MGKSFLALRPFSSDIFRSNIAIYPLSSIADIREGRVVGDISVMGNPHSLSILPFRFLDFGENYHARFQAISEQTSQPACSMINMFKLRWNEMTSISALGISSLADIADIFCHRVYQAVDINGIIVKRLGYLLMQVAHGLISIVRSLAALNSFNYSMLGGA
jgi:hypothetical protein